MRYTQQAIPASSRWFDIFVRYIDQIAARVRAQRLVIGIAWPSGFRGDPDAVTPDPARGEGEPPSWPLITVETGE